jgi:hypothetical protein
MSNHRPITRLKEADDHVIVLPFWEKKINLSNFDKSERPFDTEWADKLPRLREIEQRNCGHLVSKRYKAETVCVYLLKNNPFYIHRRSTKDAHYEWLVKVNEYNLWSYEKKVWIQRDNEAFVARTKALRAEQIEEERQKALATAEKEEQQMLVAEAAYQGARADMSEAGREKLEKEKAVIAQYKADLQNYKDACMYHANHWLHGHTSESLRNSEEWALGEQEEAELREKVLILDKTTRRVARILPKNE